MTTTKDIKVGGPYLYGAATQKQVVTVVDATEELVRLRLEAGPIVVSQRWVAESLLGAAV